jgi:hypothetical protein
LRSANRSLPPVRRFLRTDHWIEDYNSDRARLGYRSPLEHCINQTSRLFPLTGSNSSSKSALLGLWRADIII